MLLEGSAGVSQMQRGKQNGHWHEHCGTGVWYGSRSIHSSFLPNTEINLLSFFMRIDALLCKNMSGSLVPVFPTLYEDVILLISVRSKERKLGLAAARLHLRWST